MFLVICFYQALHQNYVLVEQAQAIIYRLIVILQIVLVKLMQAVVMLLYMFSGTTGRFQIKANSGGVVTIYGNTANNTGYGINFNLASTTVAFQINANGTGTTYYNWTGPAFTATSDSIFLRMTSNQLV